MPPIFRQDRIERLLSILAMTAAFVQCLVLSWNQWGDLIVDYGRDLEVSTMILQGKVLYRDIRYFYEPFTPYFNALLFKLFGVHMNVLVAAGVTSAALVCLFIYRIARIFLARLEASATVILFIYTCAFTKLSMFTIFSFASPYTYAAVYGLVASLGSLYFLIRHARKQKRLDYIISLGCLILTSFCKPEVLLPALLIHGAFLLLNIRSNRITRWHPTALAIAIAVIVGGYGMISWWTGPGLFTDNLAGPAVSGPRGSGNYIRDVMGILDWKTSLKECLPSALIFILVPLAAYVLHRVRQSQGEGSQRITSVVAFLLGGCAYFIITAEMAFRFLPFVLAAGLAFMTWSWWKEKELRAALLPRMLLVLFALSCMARVILKVSAHHFGFYLMPAGLLALGVLLFGGLGREVNVRNRGVSEFKFAGIGLFAALALCHYQNNQIGYGFKTTDLVTPRGSLKLMATTTDGQPWGGEFVRLNRLLSAMPPNTSVLVVPQGVSIGFFSGLKHDFPMNSFLPMEFSGKYSEKYVLEKLKTNPPDVVVSMAWPMQEWGFQGFGIDYAQDIGSWMGENYSLYAYFGPGQFTQVLVRKDKSFPEPDKSIFAP